MNGTWRGDGRAEFELGIGLSTGKAAAALLGSEERLEYTLVGDTVNLAQRLQDMARPGGRTVLSEATWEQLTERPAGGAELEPELVKGRATPVSAYLIEPDSWRSE